MCLSTVQGSVVDIAGRLIATERLHYEVSSACGRKILLLGLSVIKLVRGAVRGHLIVALQVLYILLQRVDVRTTVV